MNEARDVIYAVCIPGQDVRYEAKSQIIPIMGGAHSLRDSERLLLRKRGYVFDDENAFLSPLNSRWGELSCIHWMLLNAEQSLLGNAQYRRNWLEPDDTWYDPSVLYVPEPAIFSCSMEEQFYGGHSSFDAPSMTRELADSGSWLFTRQEIDAAWAQNTLIGCNMARGSKQNYKQFMMTLFAALIPLWEKYQEQFLAIEGYDRRAIAFAAERIITCMVLCRDRILPGMDIATAPIGFIP